ncbi:MAG: hypothetical protein EZS28_045149 [Streblomastix strix]|uniref:Uncharacterized protein n=1 Tax=Streblomastix strix TaxID=222440 RepID=A0A5J4TND3_9EUKA|nr:MAG: hypothetical protein EZS28_045149 [Streblomastix strix]
MGGKHQEQLSVMFCQTHTEVDIDNRCVRNRMGGDARIDETCGRILCQHGGEWSAMWDLKSSNQREVSAVLMEMRIFRWIQRDQKVLLIWTDNTITKYNVSRWRQQSGNQREPATVQCVITLSNVFLEVQQRDVNQSKPWSGRNFLTEPQRQDLGKYKEYESPNIIISFTWKRGYDSRGSFLTCGLV